MKKIQCEVYSRVVGYYRPVKNWNDGKKTEFSHRVAFCEEVSMANEIAKKGVDL